MRSCAVRKRAASGAWSRWEKLTAALPSRGVGRNGRAAPKDLHYKKGFVVSVFLCTRALIQYRFLILEMCSRILETSKGQNLVKITHSFRPSWAEVEQPGPVGRLFVLRVPCSFRWAALCRGPHPGHFVSECGF